MGGVVGVVAGVMARGRLGADRTDGSADDQRADIVKLSASLRQDLGSKGITFVDVDRQKFRDALGRTTFYKDWKSKYGDAAWEHLEAVSGKLA